MSAACAPIKKITSFCKVLKPDHRRAKISNQVTVNEEMIWQENSSFALGHGIVQPSLNPM